MINKYRLYGLNFFDSRGPRSTWWCYGSAQNYPPAGEGSTTPSPKLWNKRERSLWLHFNLFSLAFLATFLLVLLAFFLCLPSVSNWVKIKHVHRGATPVKIQNCWLFMHFHIYLSSKGKIFQIFYHNINQTVLRAHRHWFGSSWNSTMIRIRLW